jgi:hypothetical protein
MTEHCNRLFFVYLLLRNIPQGKPHDTETQGGHRKLQRG